MFATRKIAAAAATAALATGLLAIGLAAPAQAAVRPAANVAACTVRTPLGGGGVNVFNKSCGTPFSAEVIWVNGHSNCTAIRQGSSANFTELPESPYVTVIQCG